MCFHEETIPDAPLLNAEFQVVSLPKNEPDTVTVSELSALSADIRPGCSGPNESQICDPIDNPKLRNRVYTIAHTIRLSISSDLCETTYIPPARIFFDPNSRAPRQICHPGRMSTMEADTTD